MKILDIQVLNEESLWKNIGSEGFHTLISDRVSFKEGFREERFEVGEERLQVFKSLKERLWKKKTDRRVWNLNLGSNVISRWLARRTLWSCLESSRTIVENFGSSRLARLKIVVWNYVEMNGFGLLFIKGCQNLYYWGVTWRSLVDLRDLIGVINANYLI